MSEIILDPSVAKLSPNLYRAALDSNLNPASSRLVEQMAQTHKRAKELLAMDSEKARKEFLSLDDTVKANIQYIYPNKDIFKPEQSLAGKIVMGAGSLAATPLKIAGSPFIEAFKMLDKYGKQLARPFTAARQATQASDKSLTELRPSDFSKKLLDDAYDGKNSWAWDRVKPYEEKHGKALITLARAIAEGRTVGEAIDLYGSTDAEMLKAIMYMGDEPDKFKALKENLAQDAQVSPGRDLANNLVGRNTEVNTEYWAYKFLKKIGLDLATEKGQRQAKSVVSGPIDAIYRVGSDPTSYTGVGPILKAKTGAVAGIKATTKEAVAMGGMKTRGQRLADQYQFVAERRGSADAGIDWVFKQDDVVKLWDNELGPRLKRFAEAETNYEKGAILRSIKEDFPEWYNTEEVKLFAKQGMFDAKSAKNFFINIDDQNRLLAGNVEGISFRRNGIPVSRSSRMLTSAVHRTAYATFNPVADVKTAESILAGEKKVKSAMEILKTVANDSESLVNPQIADIFELQGSLSKARKTAEKLGLLGSRVPGRILWGEDAVKNADDIRNMAALILPRDIAEALTLAIVDETPEVQLTVVRNMYYAFMTKLGVPEDIKLITLSKTFNESAGMYTMVKTAVPKEFLDEIHPSVIRTENDVPYLMGKGAVHPSQIAKGIAPLPFEDLYRFSTRNKLSEATNFQEKLGGATSQLLRSNGLRHYNNFWAVFTLFPRLGSRSNIDEMFFAGLSQDAGFWTRFGQLKFGGDIKAATAYSGSSAGIGPYKNTYYWLAEKMGFKVDPRKKLTPDKRMEIVKGIQAKLSKKLGYEVPLSEISHLQIREEMLDAVLSIYGKKVTPEGEELLRTLIRHDVNLSNSISQSMAARSSISAKFDQDIISSVFTPDATRAALKENGFETTKEFTARNVQKLLEHDVAMAQFTNFKVRLAYNEMKVVEGTYLSPVGPFFRNNALKTKEDFARARNEMLEHIGVIFDKKNNTYEVIAPEKLKGMLGEYGISVSMRQAGMSDPEIARNIIESMLLDARTAFHGSETGYNKALLDLVKSTRANIIALDKTKKSIKGNTWARAVNSIEFNVFEDATVGMRPVTGDINTNLVYKGKEKDASGLKETTTFEDFVERYPDFFLGMMDAQVTGFYRQPALTAMAGKALERLKPYQKMLSDRYYNAMLEENPFMSKVTARKQADLQAEKMSAQLAMTQATDAMLEIVDNPAIRSNLSVSIKHLARFQRATEDFHRRIFRLYKNHPIRSLYRMRLLHLGLQNMGSVYQDEKGDEYITFPTDIVINSAIEPAMRMLTGNDNYKVMSFNEFAIKLRLINPSFSPDAGQPAFAGPIAGVPILVMKSLLRELPFVPSRIKDEIYPWTTDAADFLDTFAMGHVGKGTSLGDLLKVTFPMLGGSLATAVSPTEWSKVKADAARQAIAYHQAFGNGLPVNATDAEKFEYLQNIKISASNLIIGQIMMGQVSPGYPSLKDSNGLPDFIKNSGITSWKSEFWDIYNGIVRNMGDDVTNPMELALATYVGKNPGKLAFIVPRNTKEYKVFINKTNEVKDWAVNNKKFVDTWGELAWVFAPRMGEYNPDIYSWMEAEGLIKDVSLKDYLEKVQIAEDKEIYFNLSKKEDAQLATQPDYDTRKQIIAKAARERQLLLISNPLLETELNSGDDRGVLRSKFNNLAAIVADKNSPMRPELRAAMQTIIGQVSGFVGMATNPSLKKLPNYNVDKKASKQEAMNLIAELSKMSPEVKEASRLVIIPLLNQYSREVTSATAGKE